VKLRNHRAEEFTGTLRLIAPDGFAVAPAEVPVRVAARGGKAPVKFTVSSTKAMPVAKYDLLLRLVRADGQTEAEKKAQIDYIGDRDRVVVKVAEDAYVAKGSPKANTGSAATLLVDGGDQQMGDISYTVTYLKFRFGIAGRPVSALLRLFNGGNPTSDGGVVHLVEEPWNERQIAFENRPKPGALVGRVGGPVEPRQTREVPLDLSLEGRQELSLAVEPANCDGVDYSAREGGQPAELQIEYQE
jgi:hypothetical protein